MAARTASAAAVLPVTAPILATSSGTASSPPEMSRVKTGRPSSRSRARAVRVLPRKATIKSGESALIRSMSGSIMPPILGLASASAG